MVGLLPSQVHSSRTIYVCFSVAGGWQYDNVSVKSFRLKTAETNAFSKHKEDILQSTLAEWTLLAIDFTCKITLGIIHDTLRRWMLIDDMQLNDFRGDPTDILDMISTPLAGEDSGDRQPYTHTDLLRCKRASSRMCRIHQLLWRLRGHTINLLPSRWWWLPGWRSR